MKLKEKKGAQIKQVFPFFGETKFLAWCLVFAVNAMLNLSIVQIILGSEGAHSSTPT